MPEEAVAPAVTPVPAATPGVAPAAGPTAVPAARDSREAPAPGPAAVPLTAAQEASLRGRLEAKFPRGLWIRLIAYLFVGHLFAGFLYLLFELGSRRG
ncbi:DUF6126 family protein [Streptomyces sp. NPDC089919]|uniref:DUF6126 family protein n=1 Tax=Streptomyces sp. NPDC089919 TaxID=3155188 RepID=UPI00341DE58B